MDPIKLVQGDTRPPVVVQLSDVLGPTDISDPGAVVRLKVRAAGVDPILATLVGAKLAGYQTDPLDPTSVDYTSPYDVAGKGGRVQFSWIGTTVLSGAPGSYEGEVEITFADGSIQSAFDLIKFKLRASF